MNGEPLQSQIMNFLNVIGHVATIAIIIRVLVDGWFFFTGISPALLRLGRALAKRKIAIFTRERDLKNLLVDSKLFKKGNIVEVTNPGEIGRAESENATVYLVSWSEFGDNIDQIILQKRDSTPLIVFAQPRSIPDELMNKIGATRNTSVCNFRGRLLNDLVTAMITTGYQVE
jgi:hypothetical protein